MRNEFEFEITDNHNGSVSLKISPHLLDELMDEYYPRTSPIENLCAEIRLRLAPILNDLAAAKT